MDLGFIRRNRTVAIDLSALLARTSAVQSASPTARAQVRLEAAARHDHLLDPHIYLFSQDEGFDAASPYVASFADLPGDIFRPRQ